MIDIIVFIILCMWIYANFTILELICKWFFAVDISQFFDVELKYASGTTYATYLVVTMMVVVSQAHVLDELLWMIIT